MSPSRVIVLSRHSLFAEGISNRLRQRAENIELHNIDSRDPDVLAKVIDMHPAAVILDGSDSELDRLCPMATVFEALPSLKFLRIDPQYHHVQVVTSEQHPAEEIGDLIGLIQPQT